jgi:hypothetical protein
MKMKLTYKVAHAAGEAAGNQSMRDAGRKTWNIDDYNAAAEETNKLLDIIDKNKDLESITNKARR